MNRKKLVLGVLIFALVVVVYVGLSESPLKLFAGNSQVEDTNVKSDSDTDKEVVIEEEKEVKTEKFVLEVDEKAPDFTLKDLEGNMISLSDYEGKIVLINFWATWCKFCVKEMPDLERINNEYDDVDVLAVNVNESEAIAREYIEGDGYTFQVLLDEKGLISKGYLVSAFPTSYFVDKDGIFLGRVQGMMTYDQMKQTIENIR